MPRRIRREDRPTSRRRDHNSRGKGKIFRQGRSHFQAPSPAMVSPEDVHSFIASGSSALEGRVLGVDFGEKRIGLAVSDSMGLIAQGLETKETNHMDKTINMIVAEADAYQVKKIVVGLPVNMDGTTGEMAQRVSGFVDQLRERVTCTVHTWDERLTSAAAERAMVDMGYKARGNKKKIDRIAATLLLQSYLDHQRHVRD